MKEGHSCDVGRLEPHVEDAVDLVSDGGSFYCSGS